jgi:hypothetical protein
MTTCPSCGAEASGKFCKECGAPLAGAVCASCRAPLTPGSKFCHRCGAPAGAGVTGRPSGVNNAIPWAVAGIALLALIALLAGQQFGRSADSDRPAGATSLSQGGMPSSTDIASLTPEQLSERLYDRVMAANERGRKDSVQFFLPMAVQSFQALDSLTLHQRYDLGRLGEVGGDARLAAAQADTILRRHPGHLLGLVLASRAARMQGNAVVARQYLDRLVQTEAAERRKQLPEYSLHQNDIDGALTEAKGTGSR